MRKQQSGLSEETDKVHRDGFRQRVFKLVVLCKVSSLHPLSLKEEEDIKSEFQMLAGKGKLVFGTREVSSDVVDSHFTILIQKYEKRQPQTYSDGYRHLFS